MRNCHRVGRSCERVLTKSMTYHHGWRHGHPGQSGFSLIELAMVLAVVTLLIGSLMTPLTMQVEQQKIRETQKAMEDIKEALIGYASSQFPTAHLPCPDKTGGGGAGVANDGQEDFDEVSRLCVAPEGNIPWVTLGVADVDGWGNRIHYKVESTFSKRFPLVTFSLASTGTLRVCQTTTCTTTTIVSSILPAIVVSYGKNGYGAINAAGNTNPPPTSIDELANTDLTADFVSRTPSPPGSPSGEFDDLVTWLSPNILFGRMVAAGRLP